MYQLVETFTSKADVLTLYDAILNLIQKENCSKERKSVIVKIKLLKRQNLALINL
jgi:hypothetical protein